MQWRQVTFEIACEAADAAASLLGDWPEVNGVVLEGETVVSAHPEYGEWYELPVRDNDDVTITVYLPETVGPQKIAQRLDRLLEAIETAGLQTAPARTSLRMEEVDPSDWESAWREQFHAHAVGTRLLIVPKWDADDPDVVATLQRDGRMPVIVDPGMAFGTGLHATSQLCLEALEAAHVAGATVLDVGCGTGILAIGAARLGAQQVYAVDLDPVAVRAATQNAADNGLDDRIDVLESNLLSAAPDIHYDVIVANLLRDPVIALTPHASRALLPGGRFITSGYVESQRSAVLQALTAAGLQVVQTFTRDDWVTLLAVRPH